jgi:hypothetical protein
MQVLFFIHLNVLKCRLGHIDDALKHLSLTSPQPDPIELQKLQTVEKHLGRCLDARKAREWRSVLRETDAAIASGADSSALVRFLDCILRSPNLILNCHLILHLIHISSSWPLKQKPFFHSICSMKPIRLSQVPPSWTIYFHAPHTPSSVGSLPMHTSVLYMPKLIWHWEGNYIYTPSRCSKL